MNLQAKTVTFIGGGNMARSLIGGLIKQGMPRANIQVIEPNSERAIELNKDFLIQTQAKANADLLNVDIILFAVKPQVLKTVCKELINSLQNSSAAILSIVAGINIQKIREWLELLNSTKIKIIRAMPNTPALIGLGATGLFCDGELDDFEISSIESIFNAVGISIWVDSENLLDTITALSGSGPAYFFSLCEHLITAGIEHGLESEQAQQLVIQTAIGAAQMAKVQNKDSLKSLRTKVTSKGGTTEAGLKVLEDAGFEHIIEKVINTAKIRSQELSKEFL